MMIIEIEEIEDQIKLLKIEMIQIAKTTGLNSQDTICCSQKLDEVITIYQKHQQTSYEKCNVLFDTSAFDTERTTYSNDVSNIFTKHLFELPLFNLKQITQLCKIVLNVNFPMYPFS
jgi:hypothetical protein